MRLAKSLRLLVLGELEDMNICRPLRTMNVPRSSQLQPGIGVNIILKADQRSGRLTTGQVSEILTRGDHPRGVKVRLSNGQIGRVQSLSVPSNSPTAAQASPYTNTRDSQEFPTESGRRERERWKKGPSIQSDYREDQKPPESRSLADYIKVSTSSKSTSTIGDHGLNDSTQASCEKDFPNLDTALIAAILADHDDLEAARHVLSSL